MHYVGSFFVGASLAPGFGERSVSVDTKQAARLCPDKSGQCLHFFNLTQGVLHPLGKSQCYYLNISRYSCSAYSRFLEYPVISCKIPSFSNSLIKRFVVAALTPSFCSASREETIGEEHNCNKSSFASFSLFPRLLIRSRYESRSVPISKNVFLLFCAVWITPVRKNRNQ